MSYSTSPSVKHSKSKVVSFPVKQMRDFYVQDTRGIWGRLRCSSLSPAVKYYAQTIVTPEGLLVKQVYAAQIIPKDLADLPYASRLYGVSVLPLTTLALSILGGKADNGVTKMFEVAFAYEDKSSGFYCGMSADKFKDVRAVLTTPDSSKDVSR